MEINAKEKSEALQGLIQSVQKGQEKRIRQSLESILTINALEFAPEQVETLKNFVKSIKFDSDIFNDRAGQHVFRFKISNYNYQLD